MRIYFFIVNILIIGFFSTISLFAQNYKLDFQNYTTLESKGEVPIDFQKNVIEKYSDDIKPYTQIKDKSEKKLKEEYYLNIHNSLNEILYSGRVIFNDPISNYINKVANHIKQKNPGLFDNVRFYTIKSPYMNASATGTKIIFINIGTLAYLENEAQLAFIICHELAHIAGNDNMESFIEKKQVLKGKGVYGGISFDEKIDALFLHDKNIEYKADSNAIALYLKSGYSPDQILKAFDQLYYSYLPFSNLPFSKTFFNNQDFTIPQIFFKNKPDSIIALQSDKDIYHSHPNIFKRKIAVKKILDASNVKKGELFFTEKDEVLKVIDLAKFEVVRLQLLNKNYTEAIYSAYVLLKLYPENQFLLNSIAKSLYGLAKFRNTDEYHLVTSSYSKVEGES